MGLYRPNPVGPADVNMPSHSSILSGSSALGGDYRPGHAFDAGVQTFARGDFRAAATHFRASIASSPGRIDARLYLAKALTQLGEREEAIEAARTAVASDLYNAEAAHLLGALLCDDQKWIEAFPWLKLAVELDAGNALYQRDLGVLELFLGDIERARASLHRALALDPRADSVLGTLVRMTPMGGGDEEADILFQVAKDLERRQASLSPADQSQLFFALGKAHEDRKDYAKAFEAYDRANRLRRPLVSYDRQAVRERFAAIMRVFDADLFRRFDDPDRGAASNRPIFIMGLPRSGTSLVEQIVSAHPDVYGVGETDALRRVVQPLRGPSGSTYPDWVPLAKAADLQRIAAAYLEVLPKGPDGQGRTTEKFLTNYEYIGLIHLCLPNAVIINCRRDLRDCAWSAFATPFVMEQEFSYDLEELGEYCRLYSELMAHWREVLPRGRIMDAPYERLVADQGAWTRRILTHCGLTWDPACLQFHQSRRVVRSASMAQVRQPIYDSSIGRSTPFQPYLRPFLAALGAPWNA